MIIDLEPDFWVWYKLQFKTWIKVNDKVACW